MGWYTIFSLHYNSKVDFTRRFSCHYDSEVDFLPENITIFTIDMGCQQTILQLNESSFKSQLFTKVNAGSQHNLLSSDMSSMEAHSSNIPFLDIPGTSASLKVAKTYIQDPFSDRSNNPSFVPVTHYAPSINPSIVPRLIPSYVTVLETSQYNKFSDSIGIFINDIQRDPIIVSTVGPRVVPDTKPSDWSLRFYINGIRLNVTNTNILDS